MSSYGTDDGSWFGYAPSAESLTAGTLIALEEAGQWNEYLTAAQVPTAQRLSYIVIDCDYNLLAKVLEGPDLEGLVIGDRLNRRPAVLLHEEGYHIGRCFDDPDSYGLPAWDDFVVLQDSALKLVYGLSMVFPKSRGWLRGGGADAGIPDCYSCRGSGLMGDDLCRVCGGTGEKPKAAIADALGRPGERFRLRGKGPARRGSTPGEGIIRDEIRRKDDEVVPRPNRGTSHADKGNGKWLNAYPRGGLAVGALLNLPGHHVKMGNLALFEEITGGHVVIAEYTSMEEVAFRHQREDELKRYLGGVTPRGADASAGVRDFGAELLKPSASVCGRVLPLREQGGIRIEQDLQDVVKALGETEVLGWPLKGPRSVKWVMSFCANQCGGGPCARALQFMQLTKLQYSDGHMTEYAVLGKVLEFAMRFDGLDVSNLVCMELISRRVQLIEERYRHRMPQVNRNNLDPEGDTGIFLGLGTHSMEGRGALCVMPALSEYIGEELPKEATVIKGKVKAHELRIAMNKIRGNPNKNKPKDDE